MVVGRNHKETVLTFPLMQPSLRSRVLVLGLVSWVCGFWRATGQHQLSPLETERSHKWCLDRACSKALLADSKSAGKCKYLPGN